VVILFFTAIIGWIFLRNEEKPFIPEEIIGEEKDIKYFFWERLLSYSGGRGKHI